MSAQEKQDRENLVNTILSGTVAALGGDAAAANAAARIEMENNILTSGDMKQYYALMKTCRQNGNCDQIEAELKILREKRTERFMAVCGGGNAEICVKEFGDMGDDNYDNIKPLLKEIAANNDVPESFFYLLEDAYRDNLKAIPYIVAAKTDFYEIEKGLTDHLRDAAMIAMFGGSLKVKVPGANPGKGASNPSGNTKTPNTSSGNVGKGTNGSTQTDAAKYFGQHRQYWTKDPIEFKGNKVYQRNDLFDPNFVSSWKVKGKTVTGTNLERMAD